MGLQSFIKLGSSTSAQSAIQILTKHYTLPLALLTYRFILI